MILLEGAEVCDHSSSLQAKPHPWQHIGSHRCLSATRPRAAAGSESEGCVLLPGLCCVGKAQRLQLDGVASGGQFSVATYSTEPAAFKRNDEDGCLVCCSAVWRLLQVSWQEDSTSNWNLRRSAVILLLDAKFWKGHWFFWVCSAIVLWCW